MPQMSLRGPSRRRAMNEINMVPFIDVMLVLLIIFMVTAPLITAGVVDVPSVGKSRQRPEHLIELVLGLDEQTRVRVDGKDGPALKLSEVGAQVDQLQAGDASVPVVISAEKSVRYELVVKLMDALQRAGVQRVGLSVKNGAP